MVIGGGGRPHRDRAGGFLGEDKAEGQHRQPEDGSSTPPRRTVRTGEGGRPPGGVAAGCILSIAFTTPPRARDKANHANEGSTRRPSGHLPASDIAHPLPATRMSPTRNDTRERPAGNPA